MSDVEGLPSARAGSSPSMYIICKLHFNNKNESNVACVYIYITTL